MKGHSFKLHSYCFLKGNEALEKKARKYGEELKIKKKIKIPLFPASQTTF